MHIYKKPHTILVITIALNLIFVITTTYYFRDRFVMQVLQGYTVHLNAIKSVALQPEWRHRDGLSLPSGTMEVMIREFSKLPGVVFLRAIDERASKVIYSTVETENDKLIVLPPQRDADTWVHDTEFLGEEIYSTTLSAEAGQFLWMGVSKDALHSRVNQFMLIYISISMLFAVVVILLLGMHARRKK